MNRQALPAYQRIKNHISRPITSGRWQAGDAVPSEHALMQRFDVSRMTVNRAMRELVAEGLITRTRGSGSFVALKKAPPGRLEVTSGRPWETRFSYSRAVRVGPFFQTSLTSPADAQGRILFLGDVYGQTRQSLSVIGAALEAASMTWQDVVATRIYMLDTTLWADAARAHAEIVVGVRPALSFIGVANFFDPDILVETEVTAWAQSA